MRNRLSSVDGVLASRRVTVEERQGHIRRLAICGHPLALSRCHHGGTWRLRLLDTVRWGDVDRTGLRRHLAVFAGRPVCARSGGGRRSHCVPAARCASPGCSNTRMTADQPATTMWRLARFPQLQTISTNAWSRPRRCLTPCSHCSNPRYPRGHRTPRSSLQSAGSNSTQGTQPRCRQDISGGGKARSLPL